MHHVQKSIQTRAESPDFRLTDRVSNRVALGLDMNAIKP